MALGTAATIGLAAGGALLGGISGSQSKGGGTTKTSSTSTPWAPQIPFLEYGFDQSKIATQNALNNPVYNGQRVADLNPTQLAAISGGGNFANNNYGNAQGLMNTSMGVMNTGSGFAGNAANLYGNYAGNQIPGTLAAGNAFANNPYVNSLIDASSRDVTRNLYENQLPTLARAASGSGNTNSTRAGVENAVAMRGAGDRLADISGQIRSQFFNQGVNQYNQGLTNELGINSQLAGAYGAGVSGMNSATGMGNNLFTLGSNAGNLQYANEQARNTAAMNAFNEGNTNPLQFLNSYMGNVGKNFGGTTSGTNTAPTTGGGWQGALQGAIGGGLGGLGVAGNFGGGLKSLGGLQAGFSQTGLGSSGFGTGLAYGNQDFGNYF